VLTLVDPVSLKSNNDIKSWSRVNLVRVSGDLDPLSRCLDLNVSRII
jgi:hypothetical protein